MNFKKKILCPKVIFLICVLSFFYASFVNSEETNIKTPEISDQKKLDNFLLLGTVLEPNPNLSIAIIKNKHSQIQKIYTAGDKFLNYRIASILRGRVVLLKDNKVFLMNFPLGAELEPITRISEDKKLINLDILLKKIPDLNALMEQGLVIPHIESGKITGLKIVRIKDRILAKMAGLREGDVLVSVNGSQLDSVQKSLTLYKDLRGQEKIDLGIKRGHTNKEITYYVNRVQNKL